MKISKTLIIIALNFVFLFKLKGQSEINFDTINFKILQNIKENQVLKLRIASIGCFHIEQCRVEFKKENEKIKAALFNDADYDIFDGVDIVQPNRDSLLYLKTLSTSDLDSIESTFLSIYKYSKNKPSCSTTDYFTFYDDKKCYQHLIVSFCNQKFIEEICNKIKNR